MNKKIFPFPLNELSPAENAVLTSFVTELSLDKHQILFQANDEADGFFVIDEGVVRIEIDEHGSDPDEPDGVLAYLEKGEILGELSLLDNLPRSASAITHTKVELRKIGQSDFEQLKVKHSDLASKIVATLGRAAALKLRDTSQRLDQFLAAKPDPFVEKMMDRAEAAQAELSTWSESRIDKLTFDLAQAVEARSEDLAKAAVEETRLGNVADKTMKNRVASLGVWHSFHGKTGAGVLASRRMDGITEVATPIGIIFGIIPVTNPTSTFVFKALIAIKSRNAIVLSPNRGALKCCNAIGEIIHRVLVEHGAPTDCVQWIKEQNSRKQINLFMGHPKVGLVLATGGPGLVRAAYSSGNPAIGVGAGNAPTLICSDADIEHAAHSISISKSFDNGLICGSEHNLIATQSVHEPLVQALESNQVAVLDAAETELFHKVAIGDTTNRLQRKMIGQSAQVIAGVVGIKRDYEIKVIVVCDQTISADNPLSREKMTPVLSLYTVADEVAGFEACRQLLAIDGRGHTAIIHTQDKRKAERFGQDMCASRILVNSPGAHGVVGMTTNLQPSLTLGCGTFGGTSTTDNVSYAHVRNIKRIAHYAPERKMLLGDGAAQLMRRPNLWVSKFGRNLSWLPSPMSKVVGQFLNRQR